MKEYAAMLGRMKSRADFLEFMRLYIPEIPDASVRAYLEALAAWAADMDGYYQNTGNDVPKDINWDFIAALLYAGSIYE